MMEKLLALCRGDIALSAELLRHGGTRWWLICGGAIVLGCSLFGAAIGWWRAPLQGVYTAAKMPLLIFLTCGANALLNGLLAQVLGAGLTFRQSSLALLMSFTIAALVLAALSPVIVLLIANAPPLSSAGNVGGHSVVLLSTVLLIAYAGAIAVRLLSSSSGSSRGRVGGRARRGGGAVGRAWGLASIGQRGVLWLAGC
jgi:hypothetical protein